MPTQQQIERFTLAFHVEAVSLLRSQPGLRDQALAVLDRWESGGATASGRDYRTRWRQLLRGNLDQLEQAVCVPTDEAATLRSVSPLGFVLDDERRRQLWTMAMAG